MEKMEQNLPPRPAERKSKPRPEKKERGAGGDYENIWEIMEEESLGEYAFSWSPEMRKSYTEQGAEFLVDAHEKGVETMIFLDKSARPLAGFFRELWKRMYPEEKIPAMRFMADFIPQSIRGYISSEKIAKTFAASAKEFNKKTVLLVDEIIETGKGLLMAADKFTDAFPAAKVLVGGMYAMTENHDAAPRDEQAFLDIPAPEGSGTYFNRFSAPLKTLGQHLYHKSDVEVEEVPGAVVTKAARAVPAKNTWSYLLRQVGRHELLDSRSIEGINKKIAEEWRPKEDKERLRKVREAYEKLMD